MVLTLFKVTNHIKTSLFSVGVSKRRSKTDPTEQTLTMVSSLLLLFLFCPHHLTKSFNLVSYPSFFPISHFSPSPNFFFILNVFLNFTLTSLNHQNRRDWPTDHVFDQSVWWGILRSSNTETNTSVVKVSLHLKRTPTNQWIPLLFSIITSQIMFKAIVKISIRTLLLMRLFKIIDLVRKKRLSLRLTFWIRMTIRIGTY